MNATVNAVTPTLFGLPAELVLQLVIQGGGLVILAGFLYLFITRILPRFLDALDSSRREFTAALHEQGEEHSKTMLQISMDMRENTKTLDKLQGVIGEQTVVLQNCQGWHPVGGQR